MTAAAPSVMPEELPAVTLPSFENTGGSMRKSSIVVVARMGSSVVNRLPSPKGRGGSGVPTAESLLQNGAHSECAPRLPDKRVSLIRIFTFLKACSAVVSCNECPAILECADLSALWSVATCRDYVSVRNFEECGAKPPADQSGDKSPHSKELTT